MRSIVGFKRALALIGFVSLSSTASAALITTIVGNDCSGVFGQGFDDCKIPAQYDPNQSPIIIKFDGYNSDTGTFGSIEINALFPTIDGSEFDFVFDTANGASGTWIYTPGPGDPAINFYVAKGGPNFNLFGADNPNIDDWFTPTNPANDQLFGLSHLSFYDTSTQQVPEPMSLLLLGAGLLSLRLVRRRAAA